MFVPNFIFSTPFSWVFIQRLENSRMPLFSLRHMQTLVGGNEGNV
jgi:hypothetical protein